jgi:hypothetical protein
MGIIQYIGTFFGYPNRQSILQLSIEKVIPQTNRFELKYLFSLT